MKFKIVKYGNRLLNITGFLVISFCVTFLFSCGYKFTGSGELPEGIKSIYIQILENRSSETRIENVFSNDLIKEITQRDKTLLKRKDSADACLTGTITSVSIKTISHLDSISSFQRRVTVDIHMKLISKESGGIVWERKQITESEAYDVNQGDRFVTDQNRRDALERISERFSEKVYKLLTENF
jgi:hypothetical protein